MNRLFRKGSKILDEFAESIHSVIRALPDEELESLYKACKRVTTRNCWWGRFDVTPGVLPFILEEMRERPIRRKQDEARIAKEGAL